MMNYNYILKITIYKITRYNVLRYYLLFTAILS